MVCNNVSLNVEQQLVLICRIYILFRGPAFACFQFTDGAVQLVFHEFHIHVSHIDNRHRAVDIAQPLQPEIGWFAGQFEHMQARNVVRADLRILQMSKAHIAERLDFRKQNRVISMGFRKYSVVL